jgi:hypothetical protein
VLLKLLKFVLVTRFSRPLLVFLPLFAIYVIWLSSVIPSGSISPEQTYTGVGLTAFMLVIPVVNGGLIVLKSDRDYLFTLPVSRRDLTLSLFIAQFLSFGIVGFFVLGYDLPLHGSAASLVETIVVFASLSLLATSLGPVSYAQSTSKRILIIIGFGALALSAFLGFPFTPSALFTGHALEASIAAVVLAAILVPLALRSLETVELDLMRAMISRSSTEIKGKGKSFVGMSATSAIYSQNFSIVEFSGRMNMAGGGGAYRSGRISLSRATLITIALAVVYFIAIYRYSPGTKIGQSFFAITANPIIIVATVYITISIVFMSMSVLGNERLWLGFTSMSPTNYLRKLIVAKALSLLVLMSPFVAADVVLAFFGVSGALSAAIGTAFILPSALVLVVYITGLTSPLQIKEEMMMPGQFNLRQMILVLPMLLTIVLLEASTIFLPFAIAGSIFMVLLSFLMLRSKRFGNRIIQSMVKNGFV